MCYKWNNLTKIRLTNLSGRARVGPQTGGALANCKLRLAGSINYHNANKCCQTQKLFVYSELPGEKSLEVVHFWECAPAFRSEWRTGFFRRTTGQCASSAEASSVRTVLRTVFKTMINDRRNPKLSALICLINTNRTKETLLWFPAF